MIKKILMMAILTAVGYCGLSATNENIRAVFSLKDGSTLVGEMPSDNLKVKLVFGEVAIPFDFVSEVKIGENSDALYCCNPVMDICRVNGWDFLLTFKEGSMPRIWKDVCDAQKRAGHSEWVKRADADGRDKICGMGAATLEHRKRVQV